MTEKFDKRSLQKLREAAEAVAPQSNPRAAKSLADLKEAVKRMEQENQKGK